ncbi:MAG: Gfo/Idh/MocA family protein [Promethearchaeota archaeon]
MKLEPPIRVGIVGTGRISDLNVLGYLDNPKCEVVAVADPDEKSARARLSKWGLKETRWYADYVEMVEREDLAIVDILTPHHLHATMTVKCAELGVPGISVQKPMATTIFECKQMVDACSASGTKLKVYENFVFYPPYVEAKKLIDSGVIGEPRSVYVRTYSGRRGGWKVPLKTWLWRVKAEKCGGGPVVFDDGFHKFSLAYWFMGRRPIERVKAWIDPDNFTDSPAFIMFEFAGGSSGTIDFQMGAKAVWPSNYYSCDEFVEVTGTRGWLRVNQCTSGGNSMSKAPQFPPIVVFTDGKVSVHGEGLERDWSASFRESTRDFVECMIGNREPTYTGEEGLHLTQFAKAPYVSAEDGDEVALEDLGPEWDRAGCSVSSFFTYRKFLRYMLRVLRGPATRYRRKVS